MKKLFTKLSCFTIVCILAFSSCTDLHTTPYSQITAYNFLNNRLEVMSVLLRPYTHANAWAGHNDQRGVTFRSELMGGQVTWPQKGRHGWDGGQWGRLRYRSWLSDVHDGVTFTPWELNFWGIGFINNAMWDFRHNVDWEALGMTADRDPMLAELRANRAWHHLRMMCLYGNIPIVENVGGFDDFPLQPANQPRAEVFAWIENEFLTALAEGIPPLGTDGNWMMGRISREGVWAMLVDMYLNAEAWGLPPRWDDAIRYARLLTGTGGNPAPIGLNSRPLALDPDIIRPFTNNNHAISQEGIFQIAYTRASLWIGRGSWGAYRESNMLNTRDNGNNGAVVTPSAFFAYSENDLRRTNWFMYGIGNAPILPQSPHYGTDPSTATPSNNTSFRTNMSFQGPFPRIGTGRDGWDFVLGQEEFNNMPLVFAFKPIRAYYTVSGTSGTPLADRRITITELLSPEFPTTGGPDCPRYLLELAFNGRVTKEILVGVYDGRNLEENAGSIGSGGRVFREISGSLNPTFRGMYDWTDRADYRFVWECGTENTGARLYKWHLGPHTDVANYANNHFMVYRMTWVYFALAEALMRQNGGVATQEAVDLINASKSRAFTAEDWPNYAFTTATLTMDALLRERGREFIGEGWIRQDLIRFDAWETGIPGCPDLGIPAQWDWPMSVGGAYPDGSGGTAVTSSHTRIWPIPFRAMESNPNLVQNPGYN